MKPFLPLVLLLSLAGCAGRAEPRVYVLGSRPGNTAQEGGDRVRDNAGRLVIEVRRVLIPDHLDTTSLIRARGGLLVTSETGVWGERLSSGLTQALAAALAKRVPAAVVTARPPDAGPAMQVLVDILALRCGGGDCVMTARWTVPRPGDATRPPRATMTGEGRFVTHGTGDEDAAMVNGIDDAVEQLAARIAARL